MLLYPLARGHVACVQDEALDARVVERVRDRGSDRDPASVAVLPAKLDPRPVAAAALGQRVADGRQRTGVLGEDELLQPAPEELLGPVAEDPPRRRVTDRRSSLPRR